MVSAKVDGVLRQWGQLLFYPEPRYTPATPGQRGAGLPGSRHGGGGRGHGGAQAPTAAQVRARIAGVVSGSPQVIVRVTGGGRGMRAIAQDMAYIGHGEEYALTDERGQEHQGPDERADLRHEWQCAGSYVPAVGDRREALNVVMDLPEGSAPAEVLRDAALEVAAAEFTGHRYVWALHTHQAHPHMHFIVKAEGQDFRRLSPGPADLHRWRDGFAQALRSRGIRAEATRRHVHGSVHNADPIWIARARKAGELRQPRATDGRVTVGKDAQRWALTAWGHIHNALAASPAASDRALAQAVKAYLARAPLVRHMAGRARAQEQAVEQRQRRDQQEPQQARRQGNGIARG